MGRFASRDYYLTGPYALDPLYHMFLQGIPNGAFWLREVASDNFTESDYYYQFYSRIGLSDEIDIMWRLDSSSALLFFLERGTRNPAFRREDLAALHLVLPLIFSASDKHHQLTTSTSQKEAVDPNHSRVQSTIEHFASSLLTQRERQVLFYMLRGYSAGMTAERLSTTQGTIKIHCKNIYRKLDISSQAELFSLFINYIPFAFPGQPTDPLEIYQRKPPQAKRGPSLI
jgi:DNA-binding CsgD family transcriptional regulator